MNVRQKQFETSSQEAIRQWIELCLLQIQHRQQEAQESKPQNDSQGNDDVGGHNE